MCDEFRVLVDEDFPGRPKIKLLGMVAEKFPMHAGPDKPAVGVDVDFGDAKLGRWQVFIFIHAAGGRVELAAGGVDSFDFFDRHARAAVHDDGRAGNPLLNFLDDVEVEPLFPFEFVGAMARADGGGKGIAAGLPNELDGLLRIGEGSVAPRRPECLLPRLRVAQALLRH